MRPVYYGKESVISYIDHVGLSNFKIYVLERGNNYNIPIFTSLKGNIKEAIKDFGKFSDGVLMGNPTDETVYYIRFYADPDKLDKHQQETYFAFNKEKEDSIAGVSGGNNMNDMFSMVSGLMSNIMPMAKAQVENEMLRERLEELESEPEPEPEPNQMMQVMGMLLPKLLDKLDSPKVQVAGDTIQVDSKSELLNKALEILKEHDPDLETDLYKLSQVAQNNPEQFKMLLTMLRTM